MMQEEKIKILLEDIISQYMVGYVSDDLDFEAEKWGQIQVLEWILSIQAEEAVWLMVSEKTKSNVGAILAIFFIVGIFFMIIDEGVGIIFGIGLLLFLIGLIGIITGIMWSIAVSADNFTRRF